jgi:ATP-dependent Clp protease ATP-binding subunit ClpX
MDLEKTIFERWKYSYIGFRAPLHSNMRESGLKNVVVTPSLLDLIESNDLIAYGLILEFIEIFIVLVNLSDLTQVQLIQVLTNPRNVLGKKYKKVFDMRNVNLHFTEGDLRHISQKEMFKSTGSCGLHYILENLLTDSMFEILDAKKGEDKICCCH